jgi:hypothetical protein
MTRHDETSKAADERLRHKAPARPDQPDEGFETGFERPGETPEEEREPNFARGIAEEPVPGTEEHGRFSKGHEKTPADTPEKKVERRFSEGQERSPTSD